MLRLTRTLLSQQCASRRRFRQPQLQQFRKRPLVVLGGRPSSRPSLRRTNLRSAACSPGDRARTGARRTHRKRRSREGKLSLLLSLLLSLMGVPAAKGAARRWTGLTSAIGVTPPCMPSVVPAWERRGMARRDAARSAADPIHLPAFSSNLFSTGGTGSALGSRVGGLECGSNQRFRLSAQPPLPSHPAQHL
jgi:hypothetical protein